MGSGIPKVEGRLWEVEFQKWRVEYGKWNSENGFRARVLKSGIPKMGVLKFWRGLWRQPPPARGAREKNGYFCHFLSKILGILYNLCVRGKEKVDLIVMAHEFGALVG